MSYSLLLVFVCKKLFERQLQRQIFFPLVHSPNGCKSQVLRALSRSPVWVQGLVLGNWSWSRAAGTRTKTSVVCWRSRCWFFLHATVCISVVEIICKAWLFIFLLLVFFFFKVSWHYNQFFQPCFPCQVLFIWESEKQRASFSCLSPWVPQQQDSNGSGSLLGPSWQVLEPALQPSPPMWLVNV